LEFKSGDKGTVILKTFIITNIPHLVLKGRESSFFYHFIELIVPIESKAALVEPPLDATFRGALIIVLVIF